ncbi:MAG: peptide chain release factor 2 [bacterium]
MSRERPVDLAFLRQEVQLLNVAFRQLAGAFNPENLLSVKAELEKASSQGDFWQSKGRTQVLQEMTRLEESLTLHQRLVHELEETEIWLHLMDEEDITPLLSDLEERLTLWKKLSREMEETIYLNGPYDFSDAILSVHAGAGGTDAQDWAEMLVRMFLRWAEESHFQAEVVDLSPGEEAGIKSSTILIKGSKAYGLLRNEKGVHRLVRISPFDSNHRRHTSFALVDVIPEIESQVVVINPDDLRIDTFRSSGHGGQNLQKTDSAVRITHIPSGIVVCCQNERSQLQNKATAMKILQSRMTVLASEEDRKKLDELRGEFLTAAWGNQIRSYVLHPYTMVKDHRTGYEVGDVIRVLNGDITPFIWENLRHEQRTQA